MSKRYFYIDPLAAAWMAKHFGMRFLRNENDPSDYWVGRFDILEDMAQLASTDERHTYYIHTDSLELLEPLVGDITAEAELIVASRTPYAESSKDLEIATALNWFRSGQEIKIIQRNGIPFMWPECEE